MRDGGSDPEQLGVPGLESSHDRVSLRASLILSRGPEKLLASGDRAAGLLNSRDVVAATSSSTT